MKTRGKFGVFLVVLVLFTAGCATKVPVNMLKPAKYHEAAMLKTVAVLPFNGKGGQEFASELEGVLARINIDDKQYFTLIDRTSLDKVMSEMKLAQSGLIDQSSVVELGKMVGAQGIYTGTIGYGFKGSRYTEKREECSSYEQKTDKKGRTYDGKCISWRRWNVNCTRNVLNLTCNPKLVEVKTGRVLYAQNISGVAEDAKCEDVGAPQGEYELLEAAKQQVKSSFRRDVAPYYETRMVKLMDSKDGIDNPMAADKLKQGIDWADKKRLDKACMLWGEAASLTTRSYALAYNLGVCAESRADVEAAYELYKKSEDILGKPNDEITNALLRTGEAVKNARKLKEQMQNLEIQEAKVAPAETVSVQKEQTEDQPPPKKVKKKKKAVKKSQEN